MKTFLLTFLLTIMTFFSYSQDCSFSINLEDTYGDGWNGNSIDVILNGTIIHNDITLASEWGPDIFTFVVNYGDIIEITADLSGSWVDECFFYLTDGNSDNTSDVFISNTTSSYIVANDCSLELGPGDCCGANLTVCDDISISTNPTGAGTYQELTTTNAGCLEPNEHYTNWIYFHAEVDVTICFDIISTNSTDYDWAIWNDITCPPTSAPIRCSSIDGTLWGDTTGMRLFATDMSDANGSANGDGFTSCIDALAGEEFILLIDNWNGTNEQFELVWYLSNSGGLDCDPLPVSFLSSYYDCSRKTLTWQTISETNNDYFLIQTGSNYNHGMLVPEMTIIEPGNGNTNNLIEYSIDFDSKKEYIELWQVDYDGTRELLNTLYSNCIDDDNLVVTLYPNPTEEGKNVSINGEYKIVQIYDMLGKEIYTNIINNQIIGLRSGFYVVVIDNKYKIKLIVN